MMGKCTDCDNIACKVCGECFECSLVGDCEYCDLHKIVNNPTNPFDSKLKTAAETFPISECNFVNGKYLIPYTKFINWEEALKETRRRRDAILYKVFYGKELK